jgi:hypothetical protein
MKGTRQSILEHHETDIAELLVVRSDAALRLKDIRLLLDDPCTPESARPAMEALSKEVEAVLQRADRLLSQADAIRTLLLSVGTVGLA